MLRRPRPEGKGCATPGRVGLNGSGRDALHAAMRLLPLILLAAACAATNAGPSRGEARLARELAGRSAGEPRACVPISSGANLAPRGTQDLVLEEGGTIWVNRLAAPC